VTVWWQGVSHPGCVEDEEIEEVMLFWDEGKKQKSIRDLVFDNQPEDREVLTYYRYGNDDRSLCLCPVCYCSI